MGIFLRVEKSSHSHVPSASFTKLTSRGESNSELRMPIFAHWILIYSDLSTKGGGGSQPESMKNSYIKGREAITCFCFYIITDYFLGHHSNTVIVNILGEHLFNVFLIRASDCEKKFEHLWTECI